MKPSREADETGGSKRLSSSATFQPDQSVELTAEEKMDLITSARSIDSLLKWANYFVRADVGLLCTTCGTVLQYDYSGEGECFSDSAMPDSFRHEPPNF